MAKIQPLTTCIAAPSTLARSRFGVSIVPMMNGRSMRVRPSDCDAIVSAVSTIVAAKPQRRMDGKFIARVRGQGTGDRGQVVTPPEHHLSPVPCDPSPDMQETVVITGASAGVGRATAQLFGRRRAKVGLIARGRDGLEAAKRAIETAGGEALVLPLDVS